MLRLFSALRGVSVALALLGAAPALAQGLPGGANSLNEAHGDWMVACAAPNGAVRCAMTQTQVGAENRRILAAELSATEQGAAAAGVLVLPFGLLLDAGVRLGIDENPTLQELRFLTCLPAGCLVPLTFDSGAVAALRAGNAIRVTATAQDNGQEVAFSISLAGFSSALSRVGELAAL